MAKAKKKCTANTPQFFPKNTNPNWLKSWSEFDKDEWVELHNQLTTLSVSDSDAALSFRRNIYAHINAARYAALAHCLKVIKEDKKPIEKIESMMKEMVGA